MLATTSLPPSSTTKKTASPEALRKAGKDHARKLIGQLFKDSSIEDLTDSYPKFHSTECELGKILGKGGFGTVKEILGFRVEGSKKLTKQESHRRLANHETDPEAEDGFENRMFLANHCIRNGGEARYCVKFLSQGTVDNPTSFVQGITDMAVETRVLSSIEHPNICKLRGMSSENPYDEKYFIILDRLFDTLETKIEKWRRQNQRATSFIGKLTDRKGTNRITLLEQRLTAAFDLSAALGYLHAHNIIYRDLKPENCGFDIRGDIKLFDFGLVKEVFKKDMNEDGTYLLTGLTGSLRYMAPEVALEFPYNAKADTYSMSILLWQMLALQQPYYLFTLSLMKERVYGGGIRPAISQSWSPNIKRALMLGWTADIRSRYSMDQMTAILKKEIVQMRAGDDSGLEHMRRRSTFVFRSKGT